MTTKTVSGGGGNWNTATIWVPPGVPTSSDDVVCAVSSGNLTIDAPPSGTNSCQSFSCDLTYAGTLDFGSQTLNIGSASGGALTLAPNMTVSASLGQD